MSFDQGSDLYVLSENAFSVAKTHFAMPKAPNMWKKWRY